MPPEEAPDQPGAARAVPIIVVGSQAGGVMALRAEDGALLWMYPTPPAWPRLARGGAVIYVGAYKPGSGARSCPAQVTALRVRDGATLWQTTLNELCGPPTLAVDGERVFAVGETGGAQAVVALDAQTGAVRWMRPNLRSWSARLLAGWNAAVNWAALSEYLSLLQDRGSYQSHPLATHHGAVYLVGSNHRSLHALDARTSRERWRSDLRGSAVEVAASETQVFMVAYTPQGKLIAVTRVADGTTEHTLPLQKEKEKPLLLSAQGVAYLLRGQRLCAVRISDGQPIWCTAPAWKEPISLSDVAPQVCLSAQALAYCRVELVPKRLTVGALDRQTGKQLWEWRSADDLASASKAVSLVAGHGRVYVATGQGLFAFREGDGQLLWRALPKTDLSFIQPALAPEEPVEPGG